MNKLNNKGQTLVMFVIIIPIFILIFTLVYDMSNLVYEKNKLNNINYITSKYVVDNYDNVDINNLYDLIYKNDKNIKIISIDKYAYYIDINIEKDVKGIFNVKNFRLNSYYRIREDKIERIK